MEPVTYTVDGLVQHSTEHQFTPRQILTAAGLNPAERYLIQIHGRDQTSYKDNPDQQIEIEHHAKFITAALGPTEVS